MAPKKSKKKKEEPFMVSTTIYGVFDCNKKKLVKVSLDKDEIDMDLAIQFTENAYSWCEFTVGLML